MNKTLVLVISFAFVFVLTILAVTFSFAPGQIAQTPTGELDFTVSGSSECLRFLNSSVPTIYVPFTIAANENWRLTINSTKMPGGANGWTDVYMYNGYWDGGTNHTCKSSDLYSIINEIKNADFQIRSDAPYIKTFNESTQQSYTVFFIIPPGGPAAFHIILKPV